MVTLLTTSKNPIKLKLVWGIYIYIHSKGTIEGQPYFQQGSFLFSVVRGRVVFVYPFRERTEGPFEEDDNVEGTMALSSRPFLSLFLCPPLRFPKLAECALERHGSRALDM